MNKHLNPEQEIKVGEMVRWNTFPDRLYYVTKMNVFHCGRGNYCEIETVDHKFKAIVPITNLTWDDVDFTEC